MSSSDQDSTEVEKSAHLRTLQHTSSEIPNLVGRTPKMLKQEAAIDLDAMKQYATATVTPSNIGKVITEDDLTNPDGPSASYWRVIAEKRQKVLLKTIEENTQLRNTIEDLKQEVAVYKEMLEEANSFVEVIKEELDTISNNDTGIDVNDFSVGDTTVNESVDGTEESTDAATKLPKTTPKN